MSKLQEFIQYLNEQVENRSIYVWGGQGEKAPTITADWIRSMENSTANANRAIAFWKKQVAAGYGNVLRAFDCSGLGIYWLCDNMKLLQYDMNADTLMTDRCSKISRSNLRRGDWVFRVNSAGRAYHIGYVVDDSLRVVEAKGRDDGVVKRALNASGSSYWNCCGRPAVFRAEILNGDTSTGNSATTDTGKGTTSPADMPVVRWGSTGEAVRQLQELLKGLVVDGIFGPKTDAALRAYQQQQGLAVDGIAGIRTWTALLG